MSIFDMLRKDDVTVKVGKVKGCPDIRAVSISRGNRRATAVLHSDGTVNARNGRNEEVYDGDDHQAAAQKIIEWLVG